jgi:DNA repair exonuclease SbcCD ATPase subunit
VKLTKIILINFKSFVGKHEFDFLGGKPGLYFISGENKIDTSLGSNGSGKSTLIDAIKWCWTGKTVRNLKANDIHSRNVKGPTSVELHISDGETEYRIFRSWNPNKITISSDGEVAEVVGQERIDSLLGLSEDDIMNSIIYGQFSTSFLDLQPSQMLQVFTGILNLEYWTEKSDKASAEKNKLQLELQGFQRKESNLLGQIDQINSSLVRTKELSEKFDLDKEAKLAQLEEEHGKILSLCEGIPELQEMEKSTDSGPITSKISEVKEIIQDIMAESNELDSTLAVEESRLSDQLQRKKRIQSLGPECPSCSQMVAGQYRDSEILRHDVSIKSTQGTIQEPCSDQNRTKNRTGRSTGSTSQVRKDLEAERAKEHAQIIANAEISRKKALLEAKLDALEVDFRKLESETNTHSEMVSSDTGRIYQGQGHLDRIRSSTGDPYSENICLRKVGKRLQRHSVTGN